MRIQKIKNGRLNSVVVLVIIIILSITVLANLFSSPRFHSKTIDTLNRQRDIATTMSVAVTAASTTLSLLPDDTASPIAGELANLTQPLFVIVCIVYLEKFLLTTFGWLAFTFLIPIGCVLIGVYIFKHNELLLRCAYKLFALALVLLIVIPAGAHISAMIEDTFHESISATFSGIEGFEDGTLTADEDETNAFVRFFTSLKDDVFKLVETSKNMLDTFMDAIAVMLITSCAIPILTAILFVFVVKSVFAPNVSVGDLVKRTVSSDKEKRTNDVTDK